MHDSPKVGVVVIGLADLLWNAYRLQLLQQDRLPGGYIHQIWRVDTDQGAYAVKWYRGIDWRPKVIEPTLRIQIAAVEAGLPVPPIRSTVDGALLAPWQDGWIVTFALMPGRRLEDTELCIAAAHATGVALARLHQSLAHLPTTGTPFRPCDSAIRHGCEQVFSWIKSGTVPPNVRHLAEEAAQYRLDALRRHGPMSGNYTCGVYQVIHGDYYSGNLLFSDDAHVTGILDWDFAGSNWREVEIARAFVESALTAGDHLDQDRATAFLGGYMAVQPLTADQRLTMTRLYLMRLLHGLYPFSVSEDGSLSLPSEWERLARRRHRILRLLDENLEELEDMVRDTPFG